MQLIKTVYNWFGVVLYMYQCILSSSHSDLRDEVLKFDPPLFYYLKLRTKKCLRGKKNNESAGLMAKPPRNQKGEENPIKKWCWCCGKSVKKDDKRFEDLIQTNGEEEECDDDDETKWKRIIYNKGKKDEGNLYGLHCRTQCRTVITRPAEEVIIALFFEEMNEYWIIGIVLWNSKEREWLFENVPLIIIT